MYRIIVCLLLLCLASVSFAESNTSYPKTKSTRITSVPSQISFQGKLLINGSPFTGTKNITFSLSGSSWSETIQNVGIENGLYSVTLGNSTPLLPEHFDGQPIVLSIKINNETMSTVIVSSPLAIKAGESETTKKLQGIDVANTTPGYGQVLKYDGSKWSPSTDIAGETGVSQISGGSGISVSNGTGPNVTITHKAHNGDVSGTENLTVTGLQGKEVSSSSPSSGQFLKFNGSKWIAANVNTDIPNPYQGDFTTTGDLTAEDDLYAGDNLYIEDSIRPTNSDDEVCLKGGFLIDDYLTAVDDKFIVYKINGGDCASVSLYNLSNETIELDGYSGNVSIDGSYYTNKKHPSKSNFVISYSSLTGPESGIYTRNVIEINNGEANVKFEDHFALQVNPESISVQLTPMSAKSKGLAAVDVTNEGFTIKELYNGSGNYKVSFFVQGIRKGDEKYQVVREKMKDEVVRRRNRNDLDD